MHTTAPICQGPLSLGFAQVQRFDCTENAGQIVVRLLGRRYIHSKLVGRSTKAPMYRYNSGFQWPGAHFLGASTAPLSRLQEGPSNLVPQALAEEPATRPSWLSDDWESALDKATTLYPVYVLVGSIVALLQPSAFSWFVKRSPASYSITLGAIMLAMGLTLHLGDLVHVLVQRPFAVLFGCSAQYGIMPLMGLLLSKVLALPPDLAIGLILLACCPGGTASNVVTYIAYGDVPLSVVMTVCATLAAVVMTPLLTSILAGAFIPVDAVGLALSTTQVVVLPVLLGAWLQSTFPGLVARVTSFAPLAAVLMSSLLCCSVFSANIPLFLSVSTGTSVSSSTVSLLGRVSLAVLLVHAAGFFFGYLISATCRFKEPQRRAVSIEVGMQNSSLGVVLATRHFASPLCAFPAAISAVLMNIMASSLAAIWRNMGHLDESGEVSKQATVEVADLGTK